MSPLEIAAVLVNALGVWLTTRRTLWCWPVGLIGVLLYGQLFFEVKLYSDMLLQLAFALLQGYGWWRWKSGQMDAGKVRVERLAPGQLRAGLVAGALGGIGLGLAMHALTDAALPWLDAQLTAFSLVASLWAARKQLASWWLWIVLDAIYIGLYLYKDLSLTAGLYAAFVVLAALGLRDWGAALARQENPTKACAAN
jgi:nicotinamide mononucleotide transporter